VAVDDSISDRLRQGEYLAMTHPPSAHPGLLPTRRSSRASLKSATSDRLLDAQHSCFHTFTEMTRPRRLTDQLGVAVQNTRSYADALQRARHEEAILDLTSRIRATHDIDDILETAVHEIRKTLGAKQAVIRLAANLGQPEQSGDGGSPIVWPVKGNGQPRSGGDGGSG
jgi:hypothetical protein